MEQTDTNKQKVVLTSSCAPAVISTKDESLDLDKKEHMNKLQNTQHKKEQIKQDNPGNGLLIHDIYQKEKRGGKKIFGKC